MMENEKPKSSLTEQEIKLVLRKANIVKEAGWGKVEILIQDGHIVYTTISIGEQVEMDLSKT